MRRIGYIVLCSLVSTAVWAEEPVPSCETVTTVRCTGSAAPLALPGPATPAQPAPARAGSSPLALYPKLDEERPPSPPPPKVDPYCCESQRTFVPVSLPGGWKIVRVDGTVMLERLKKTGMPGLWGPGLVLWLGTWTGLTAASVFDNPYAAMPFFGGFIAGGMHVADGDLGAGFGYIAASLVETGGFIAMIVGGSIGHRIERMPLEVSPMALRDGGGASVRFRF